MDWIPRSLDELAYVVDNYPWTAYGYLDFAKPLDRQYFAGDIDLWFRGIGRRRYGSRIFYAGQHLPSIALQTTSPDYIPYAFIFLGDTHSSLLPAYEGLWKEGACKLYTGKWQCPDIVSQAIITGVFKTVIHGEDLLNNTRVPTVNGVAIDESDLIHAPIPGQPR
jgi:hypothetical protein